MSDDLKSLEKWAGALLHQLEPSARRTINSKVAIDLRRSQQLRIKSQQAPEGSPYTPRKNRKTIRDKLGRIKRQKSAMFSKLIQAKSFKINTDENKIGVGFIGRTARIARVHQYGLKDKVNPGGTEIVYEKRQLLGFTDQEKNLIKDLILKHLNQIGKL